MSSLVRDVCKNLLVVVTQKPLLVVAILVVGAGGRSVSTERSDVPARKI
jgi:hypothetical protein